MFIIACVVSSPWKPWIVLRILSLALLVACSGRFTAGEKTLAWQPGDLRALTAPDRPDPDLDLVAAYARLTPTDLELRFDLLGSPDPYGYDLLLILGNNEGPGGNLPLDQPAALDWQIALDYPATGLPRAFNPAGNPLSIRPRVIRSAVQDSLVARISLSELERLKASGRGIDPARCLFQAFLTLPGGAHAEDSTGPLRIDGPATGFQASTYFAFWDALPAATPVQALRRWEGAHTGPYGQRHGLGVLLHAAASARIPIGLLDLKRPGSLSALEVMGGLPAVQQASKNSLLWAPDLSYGDPQAAQTSLRLAVQAGERFQLPPSPFYYGSIDSGPPGAYQAAFARLKDAGRLRQWGALRLVPLPDAALEQVGRDGLTLPTREALLSAALSGDPARLVALGGSLPGSPWGDSLVAGAAFDYITGHPWIHVLDAADLLQYPAIKGEPDCPDLLCLASFEADGRQKDEILRSIRESPPGLFTDLAWQMYLHLTDPASGQELQALRAGYLGQVGLLLEAARWNASPRDRSDCDSDLDWDGIPECVLASPEVFLVIDPQGGRLVLAAARQGRLPIELIGPRSQVATGLGDPQTWNPQLGQAGDPQEIPGAFADPLDAWQIYQGTVRPGQVALGHPKTGAQKTFELSGAGLKVTIQQSPAGKTQIPLLLVDPDAWKPGWYSRYQAQEGNAGGVWSWELANAARVQVSVRGAQVAPHHFAESLALLKKPEDPNMEVPTGAYLPFPMAVIDLESAGNYTVEVALK